MPHQVIAIDGPAASGKSSVALSLANRLRFMYVNSGAMYRAATWYVLQHGVNERDAVAVAAIAEKAKIVCDFVGDQLCIRIDGIDPSAHLRDDAVNSAVSMVSSVPRIREILGARMRNYAKDHDLVVEGRDIGSVVFPETPFKFYIDASADMRARRREAQGERDEIAVRDRFDSSRKNAPLVIASDAEVIDSSNLTIEEVVAKIMQGLAVRGFPALVRAARTSE